MDAGVLAALQRRYAEPHRHFHRWPRVAALLAEAEEVAAAIADRPAFILAVLFHAAVFDRRIADGARQSAALMRGMLGGRLGDATLARAESLIMAAAAERVPETRDASLRGDAALLLDLGNLVLASADFAAEERAHRAEYAHLGDESYATGRVAALRMLLWRERVYLTDRYYLAFEKRARRNLERVVRAYEGR